MKAKTLLVALFSVVCVLFANESFAQDDKNSVSVVYFYVEGLNCENCQAKIEKNVSFEKGITELAFDLPTKMVAVTYKKDKTTLKKLLKAFDKIKMPAKMVPVNEEK